MTPVEVIRKKLVRKYTIVYARETPPLGYTRSIFLVGPTPRSLDVPSWRPQVFVLLDEADFDGVVFVPEDRPDADGVTIFRGDYDDQIAWEDMALNLADVNLVWIPRTLDTLPGFTTNVEFGEWMKSGKVVLGLPPHAVKNRYLELKARELDIPVSCTLADTVTSALEFIGEGSYREAGEREVPLYIWQTPQFQQWYGNLKIAGNVLEHARVLWNFRVGPEQRIVFMWALHVEVYITSEGRSKVNEFVLARPDIATILLYRRADTLDNTEVALVREFRSPVSNISGFVWELPGGSSFTPGGDPRSLAAHECAEETGLELDPERFTLHDTRQLAATLSAHRAHLFSAELTMDEMAALRADADNPHGVFEDSERTFVEVTTVGAIRDSGDVDWSMLGMVLQVLV